VGALLNGRDVAGIISFATVGIGVLGTWLGQTGGASAGPIVRFNSMF
jgi:hypothetical protein